MSPLCGEPPTRQGGLLAKGANVNGIAAQGETPLGLALADRRKPPGPDHAADSSGGKRQSRCRRPAHTASSGGRAGRRGSSRAASGAQSEYQWTRCARKFPASRRDSRSPNPRGAASGGGSRCQPGRQRRRNAFGPGRAERQPGDRGAAAPTGRSHCAGCFDPQHGQPRSVCACRERRCSQLAYVLNNGPAWLRAVDDNGDTLLHKAFWNDYASPHGLPDTVRLLILRGADVNVRNRDGQTPLHLAAANGSPESRLAAACFFITGRMWKRGMDVGQTPLHRAATPPWRRCCLPVAPASTPATTGQYAAPLRRRLKQPSVIPALLSSGADARRPQ